MKKGFFITAIFALCCFAMADDVSSDLLQGLTSSQIITSDSGHSAAIKIDSLSKKLTKKDKFVFSFKLNDGGISYLNSWIGQPLYNNNVDHEFINTPMLVTFSSSVSDGYGYGMGLASNGRKMTNQNWTDVVVKSGTFALAANVNIEENLGCPTYEGRASLEGNGAQADFPVTADRKDITAVAITLSCAESELTLTASVCYKDSGVLNFWTTVSAEDLADEWDEDVDYANWNTLSLNTDFVDLNSIYLSNGFSEGETAADRNAKLLAPEPATATLSLLALAGLATRRRRK